MEIREQYAYLKPQPMVWLAILGSAGLHLGLVGLLVVGGVLKEGSKSLKDRAIITKLLKKGKKLDDSWLPHKAVKPPPAPAPSPKAVVPKPDAKPQDKKPQPKKPDPKPANPSKVDYTGSMDSALTALKDTKYEEEGDPDGVDDGQALIKQKGDEYLTKVYKAIKGQYEVPELISPKERMFLRADVVIYIDAGGGIKNLKFKEKSNNSLYDSAVEGAIRRSAPFPAPPQELADAYAREGIEIPFRASKM